jgi:hypothetical protein
MKRPSISLCMAAAALWSAAAGAAEISSMQIAGRWTGNTTAQKSKGPLTLDIVACGNAWCGIKVEAGDKCGATALKLDSVKPLGDARSDSLQFDGSLELAEGTEAYVVQAWLIPRKDTGALALQIKGDTGGQFRPYRRLFPFETQLSRVGDAICHAPRTVSSLP